MQELAGYVPEMFLLIFRSSLPLNSRCKELAWPSLPSQKP